MRVILLVAAVLAFDAYVFQAFLSMSQGWSRLSKGIVFVLYWSVPLMAFTLFLGGGLLQDTAWKRNLFIMLRAVVLIAYVCKLIMAGALLIDDFRRLLMKGYAMLTDTTPYVAGRSQFISQMAIAIGAIPFVTLLYGMLRNRHRYTIFREAITIPDLPPALEGLRIVQISDIHSGSFSQVEPVRRAVELINKEAADLVFFTGDLVNNKASEMTGFIDVFNKIKARYGVFSILGNHDYGDYVAWNSAEEKLRNLEQLKAIHGQMGWQLLLNEHRKLYINDEELAIIGVENWSASMRFPKYGKLAEAYQGD